MAPTKKGPKYKIESVLSKTTRVALWENKNGFSIGVEKSAKQAGGWKTQAIYLWPNELPALVRLLEAAIVKVEQLYQLQITERDKAKLASTPPAQAEPIAEEVFDDIDDIPL